MSIAKPLFVNVSHESAIPPLDIGLNNAFMSGFVTTVLNFVTTIGGSLQFEIRLKLETAR